MAARIYSCGPLHRFIGFFDFSGGAALVAGKRADTQTMRINFGYVGLVLAVDRIWDWRVWVKNSVASNATFTQLCKGFGNEQMRFAFAGAPAATEIAAVSGAGVLGTTNGLALNSLQWNHIRCRVFVGVANGSVKLWVNGTLWLNLTNVNTQTLAANDADLVVWYNPNVDNRDYSEPIVLNGADVDNVPDARNVYYMAANGGG